MKSTMLLIFVSIACLSPMSCGQRNNPTTTDFPGTYVVRYSHGLETLVLKPDGTFAQNYLPVGGVATQTNTGKWEFKTTRQHVVYLEDALLFDRGWNQPQNPPIKAVHGVRVRRRQNGMELVISEEAELSYRKLNRHK